jgi:hypothetical protein
VLAVEVGPVEGTLVLLVSILGVVSGSLVVNSNGVEEYISVEDNNSVVESSVVSIVDVDVLN